MKSKGEEATTKPSHLLEKCETPRTDPRKHIWIHFHSSSSIHVQPLPCTTSGRRGYCSPTTGCVGTLFVASLCAARTSFNASSAATLNVYRVCCPDSPTPPSSAMRCPTACVAGLRLGPLPRPAIHSFPANSSSGTSINEPAGRYLPDKRFLFGLSVKGHSSSGLLANANVSTTVSPCMTCRVLAQSTYRGKYAYGSSTWPKP